MIQLYFGEAPLAFVFGVIVGPYGANIFDPRSWGGGGTETVNEITLEVSRVILAVGVFAIGVELPKAYMAKHWRSLLFLLGPVMAWVRCHEFLTIYCRLIRAVGLGSLGRAYLCSYTGLELLVILGHCSLLDPH